MTLIHWLQDLLSTAVVTAALFASVGFLFRSAISERLRRAVGHEYDKKLEQLRIENQKVLDELRAARAEQQAFRAMAMSLMTSTRTSTLDRRTAAVERLWTSMHDTRVNLPALIAVLDQTGWNAGNLTERARSELERTDFLAVLKPQLESIAEVAKVRPFLGDQVYALYEATQSILGRAVSTTITSLQQKRFRRWYEEKDTIDLLKTVLSVQELEQFGSQQFAKLDWLFRKMQSKVVAEIQREFSGVPAAEEALAHATGILERANTLARGQPPPSE